MVMARKKTSRSRPPKNKSPIDKSHKSPSNIHPRQKDWKDQKNIKTLFSASPNRGVRVVGIGASAGGLEAFKEILTYLPNNTGFAFVVIQHLDPKHASMASEIFSRSTSMPVSEVQNGTRVKPNQIYVIPPNCNMAILHGVLQLIPRTEPITVQTAIDFFLKSLAEDLSDRAIGVILSGTASDGTEGLRAIKAEGGITFAQDPKTARYDGMPSSAIASGAVDLALSPKGIVDELTRMALFPGGAP